MHRLLSPLLLAPLLLAPLATSEVAAAASPPDLLTTISAPASTLVGSAATYTINVANRGGGSGPVSVVVQLPQTHTSPTVKSLGTVSNIQGCTPSGTTLVCNLAPIARNRSASVRFDLSLPYNVEPVSVSAIASTAGEATPVDNRAERVAVQSFTTVTPSLPQNVLVKHCTGTGLQSFADCLAFPSSISQHTQTLTDAGITYPSYGPDYGGSWQVSGTALTMEMTDLGTPVAWFSGQGTSSTCWEGRTTFASSTYVSMYQVCLTA